MRGLMILTLVFVTYLANSQVAIRSQSIGTYGQTVNVGKFSLKQSIGLPYSSVSNIDSELYFSPGLLNAAGGIDYRIPSIQSDISIYPNPVTTNLYVNLDRLVEEMNIEIYNQFGDKVWDGKFESVTFFDIDCSSFKEGMYFFIAREKSGEVLNRKFLVIN